MKNKLILIISILFIIPFILTVKSMAAEPTYTQEQKAIQEVADAYYQRGVNAQYCPWRKTYNFAPEEGTLQHRIYFMCSDFTYLLYKQAFDIDIQGGYASVFRNLAYAQKYYDHNNITTNDVIEYWEKTTDDNNNVIYKDNQGNVKNINLATLEGRKNYAKYLLENCNLQVGDIISWMTEDKNDGHSVLVYKIEYDEEGNPIDALIRESTGDYENKTTKLSKGLCDNDIYNENNNVHEGTFREKRLSSKYTPSSNSEYRISEIYQFKDSPFLAVIRPLLKDEEGKYTGNYYFSTYETQNDSPFENVCTGRILKRYEITKETLSRIKYSGIYIEKTVDVFNNSVVNLGDTLEYTIKVKNNSDNNYNDIEMIENIPDSVDIIDNGDGTVESNQLKWSISRLEAKQSIEIRYKVKVKSQASYLEKEIVSTGTVAGIPSSTVKNTISSNLNNNEKSKINQKAQTLINSNLYNGQELISKIYQNSFGINLNLANFNIEDLIIVSPGGDITTINVNNENKFYTMLLSNYYGAVRTNNSGKVYLRYWEYTTGIESKENGRSTRADTIYKENFQTGDILVYKNTQTASENVTYKTEDGVYYLIYIDEADKITINNEEVYGFVGINDNGEINHIGTDRTSLQTLLGKDYYVVLRPSMSIDIVPMNLGVSYSTTKFTNGGVKVTITANEEMLPVSGWTLSSDKKKLTKTFTKNIDQDYSIYDLGGNKTSVGIKISNIIEKMGDINKDSKINIADVIATIRHISAKEGSKYYLNEEKRFIADVNQDGKTNIADVIGIIRLISRSK